MIAIKDRTQLARALGLDGRTRKVVLLTHIIASGVWIGLDVAMAVLVFTALGTDDRRTLSATLQALQLVTVWPILTAGLLALLTISNKLQRPEDELPEPQMCCPVAAPPLASPVSPRLTHLKV